MAVLGCYFLFRAKDVLKVGCYFSKDVLKGDSTKITSSSISDEGFKIYLANPTDEELKELIINKGFNDQTKFHK